ncbi:unnamed protein product [Meloidogyne enterolobii]|uniref:Uncharacterized protein n=1 Tax=Meloidogyne enterolobii TaxID=390850 RepID=A0ACB0YT98_MELEN
MNIFNFVFFVGYFRIYVFLNWILLKLGKHFRIILFSELIPECVLGIYVFYIFQNFCQNFSYKNKILAKNVFQKCVFPFFIFQIPEFFKIYLF